MNKIIIYFLIFFYFIALVFIIKLVLDTILGIFSIFYTEIKRFYFKKFRNTELEEEKWFKK